MRTLLLYFLCALFHLHAADFHYEEGLSTGYGPSQWYLADDNCGHSQQSPIEIDPSDFNTSKTCNTPLNWNIDSTSYNWSVTHKGENGHTIVLKSDAAKSDIYLDNAFQYDGSSQHSKYKFDSLHFHWGPSDQNGSEHVFTGITSTLEVHFVHYSSDYSDVGAAVGAWDALAADDSMDMHTLGVVGFLFEEVVDSSYNDAADAILLKLASDTAMQDVWSDADGTAYLDLVIADLVNATDFENHYYHYEGSLTTPPCTPAVRWHLAQNTIKVLASTMDTFRAATKLWTTPSVDADSNFRPIQTNPSCIWTCAGDDAEFCPNVQFTYEDVLGTGPSWWDELNPLCGHEQQSPISIDRDWLEIEGTCSEPLNWNVDDTEYEWTVTHKGEQGHTLAIKNDDAKSAVYLENTFQYEGSSQHPYYKLDSFHFHWGPDDQSGSEHIYEDVTTTLEVHFVHYSSDYSDVGAAVGAWEALAEDDTQDMHTLGVVGFLFEEVADNGDYDVSADTILLKFALDSTMEDVWSNATGYATLTFSITDFVNVSDFEEHYYHYEGSLTTPPCTPAVRWHLARNTIKVRKTTMDLFREQTKLWFATGAVDADENYRPVMPYSSCIWSCGEEICPTEYPQWHYEEGLPDGPSNWGDVNALCDHEQQSPITIYPEAFYNLDTCAAPLSWHVDDTVYDWEVTHKGEGGHTLSIYNSDAKGDVYLENAWQTTSQHEKYKLYGFHFHWGPDDESGSEHIYEGSTTTFEVHFVHYSSDYADIGAALGDWEALSQNDSLDMHTLGVVGFLFEEVDDSTSYNQEADGVLLQFAQDSQMDDVWASANGSATLSFAITDLVDPEDFESNYYHYWGSLTTPPCTPAVSWHLAQNTIKVRKSTMDTFRARTAEWAMTGGLIDATTNFRPVQTNPSCVSQCANDTDLEYCPGDEEIDFPTWHYEDSYPDGPSNWDSVNSLCNHPQQSPILIDPDTLDSMTCSTPLNWNVDDTVYNWTVTHKGEAGHTLSIYNSDSKNDVYLDNAWQTTSQHSKYKLHGFHFHWGPGNVNGSEHVFAGVTSTFEVHFVHYSGDYPNVGSAVGAWDALAADDSKDMHTLGVVGFLFEEVSNFEEYNERADATLLMFAADPEMDSVWADADGSAHIAFSIYDLVDPDDFMSSYYHYWGSLTTPPCTPAVSWHLAQNTIKVRRSTMNAFRRRTAEWTYSGGIVDATTNFRPVQSNPSCITTCGGMDDDDGYCPGDIVYPDWHYEDGLADGPSNWGDVNALCDHEQQSPITIYPDAFDSDDDTCSEPLKWNVDDTVYDWEVTHKGEGGHTLSIYNTEAKSDVYLDNAWQTTSLHSKYKLYGFHFHWGPNDESGSEHIFDGVTTTFEVHFVHYSSSYSDIGAALGAWEALSEDEDADMHTLGVVGFLFEEVGSEDTYHAKADALLLEFASDPQMDAVWQNATGSAILSFAITDLVDPDDFESNYYHYWGSLTTPPCTPAVSWHLAQNTIKVRKSTMDAFRARTSEWKMSGGEVDATTNFRPVQDNPSCVSRCAGDEDEEYCPEDTIVDIEYPDWHYEESLPDGPSNWKNLAGGYLCAHSQQSPILIDPSDLDVLDSCNTPLNWHVDDTVYDWTVTHKGEGGHTLSVYSADAKNDVYLQNSYMITNQHWKYKLYGFHFHWGPGNKNGSEHVYEGTTTTLEVHFVHYSTDYSSVGDAVAAWDDLSEDPDADMHTLAVTGFLFEEVRASERYNEEADAVLLEFAENQDMTDVWSNASGSAVLSFSITDLVDPEDFESNYYHYWGSLTTPPCTPAVSWHLAQNVIPVRQSTMEAFRAKTALWTTSGGYVDATTNFRPVQSNPSCISKCAGDDDLEYCPEGKELADSSDESGSGKLMPLWISLGVLAAILLIVVLVRATRGTKQKPLAKPKPPKAEMTKVPTIESYALDQPSVVPTFDEYGDAQETLAPEKHSHSSDRVPCV